MYVSLCLYVFLCLFTYWLSFFSLLCLILVWYFMLCDHLKADSFLSLVTVQSDAQAVGKITRRSSPAPATLKGGAGGKPTYNLSF